MISFNRKNEGAVFVSPYAGYTVLNVQGLFHPLLCSLFVICIVYGSFLRIKAERKITYFPNSLLKD